MSLKSLPENKENSPCEAHPEGGEGRSVRQRRHLENLGTLASYITRNPYLCGLADTEFGEKLKGLKGELPRLTRASSGAR